MSSRPPPSLISARGAIAFHVEGIGLTRCGKGASALPKAPGHNIVTAASISQGAAARKARPLQGGTSCKILSVYHEKQTDRDSAE